MSSICEMKYCGTSSSSRTSDTDRLTQTTCPSAWKYRFSIEYVQMAPASIWRT